MPARRVSACSSDARIAGTGGLVVFLVLFFANFLVSWMVTKAVVERTLKTSAAEGRAS